MLFSYLLTLQCKKRFDIVSFEMKQFLSRVSFLRFYGFGVPLTLLETASDAVPPFLYGFRDLESLFFALIAWHPIVGSLMKDERLVLLIGALIPAVPPTAVLGAYILVRPFIRKVQQIRAFNS